MAKSKVIDFIDTEIAKVDTIVRKLVDRRDTLNRELDDINAKLLVADAEIDDLTTDKEAIEGKGK